MAEAYIVDATRSPTGRRKGGLADVHGADLGAHVIKTLVDRNGIPDTEYDDVMFGCVDAIGPLAGDIACEGTNRVHATKHDVVILGIGNAIAIHQSLYYVRTQVSAVHICQSTFTSTSWGSCCVYNVSFCHVLLLSNRN